MERYEQIDYGWARLNSGRILHYYRNYPLTGINATALCGKQGMVRTHFNDHAGDIFIHPTLGARYAKCKKCLAKLEEA